MPSGEHIKVGPNANRIEFLDTSSNASDTGSISFWNTVYNNRSANIELFHPAANTGGIKFSTHDGSSLTERLQIDSSGRVLIGKTSTSLDFPLQVQAASTGNAMSIAGESSNDISEITFYENDDSTILTI